MCSNCLLMVMVYIDNLFYTQQQQQQQQQQNKDNLDNKHCNHIQNYIRESDSPPPYTDVIDNSRLLDK